LADKVRAHPELTLGATEGAYQEFERLIDSGLKKDGYKLFEGDLVYISGDVTEDQLNEGIKQVRRHIGESLSDFFGGIGISTATADYFLDTFVHFEIHRALPVRRAVAAQLTLGSNRMQKFRLNSPIPG
jgi:hypothetical protein